MIIELHLPANDVRMLLALVEARWTIMDLHRGDTNPENPVYELLLADQQRYSDIAERLRVALKGPQR